MIPLVAFRRLRLRQFVVDEPVPLSDWEFLNRTWVGEALGFTEWLRPAEEPESLGALSIDLAEVPSECSAAVLSRLELPLAPGMTLGQISALLGPPLREETFQSDRTTFYFVTGEADRYTISCTVREPGGLIYLVVAPVGLGLED